MELTVEFVGEVHTATDSLTFGRAAQLCIDDNEYMHRLVGEFYWSGDLWWLRNLGSRIPLTLISHDGKRVELPPGAVQALSGGGGTVRFQAGRTDYELTYRGADSQLASSTAASLTGPGATLHIDLELTPREVDFLVVFCAPHLGQALGGAAPSYAVVAETWGVSVKTVDNTLQNLRRKIREAGLTGADSSDALASFVIVHGLVRQADLDWARINEPDGPRPASGGPRFTQDPKRTIG